MKINDVKIGVIAGTPIDTQMGVDFVNKKGFEALGVATASSPEEQNLLQYMDSETLTTKISAIISDFEKKGIFRTMIYCNSLSAAIDIDIIRSKYRNSNIVTPLDVYRDISSVFDKIVLWAANGQCLAQIERIFYEQNPSIDIIGISMLPVIKAIEEQKPVNLIFDEFNLTNLCSGINDTEALVLGCTHLPYLIPLISQKSNVTILDPADKMLESLL